MRCGRIRKMMSAYIDDELTSSAKEAFLLHIGKCKRCGKELEEAQAVHQLFAKAERTPAPYGFTLRVMANLEPEYLPGKSIRDLFTLRPFLPKAAAVVMMLAVMVFGIITGTHLATNSARNPEQATIKQELALDLFQATPPDSIGGAYADMMETRNEG